jgi:hypothetical protein
MFVLNINLYSQVLGIGVQLKDYADAHAPAKVQDVMKRIEAGLLLIWLF